jgi:hypothetical protein
LPDKACSEDNLLLTKKNHEKSSAKREIKEKKGEDIISSK